MNLEDNLDEFEQAVILVHRQNTAHDTPEEVVGDMQRYYDLISTDKSQIKDAIEREFQCDIFRGAIQKLSGVSVATYRAWLAKVLPTT